jgi:hypothetical protein
LITLVTKGKLFLRIKALDTFTHAPPNSFLYRFLTGCRNTVLSFAAGVFLGSPMEIDSRLLKWYDKLVRVFFVIRMWLVIEERKILRSRSKSVVNARWYSEPLVTTGTDFTEFQYFSFSLCGARTSSVMQCHLNLATK